MYHALVLTKYCETLFLSLWSISTLSSLIGVHAIAPGPGLTGKTSTLTLDHDGKFSKNLLNLRIPDTDDYFDDDINPLNSEIGIESLVQLEPSFSSDS